MNTQELLLKAEMVQSTMTNITEEINNTSFTGVGALSVDKGFVVIQMRGDFQVENVEISLNVPDFNNSEMLEDLVKAALTDVWNKVSQKKEEEMQRVLDSLDLPPGFELPFWCCSWQLNIIHFGNWRRSNSMRIFNC